MRALALVSSSSMRALALVSSSRMCFLDANLMSHQSETLKHMDVGGCELTGACDNQVLTNDVEVLAAEWLCDDKERGQPQKGLYYTGSGILAKGTWIATFGVLRESTTMAQNNGYSLLVRVGESGESTQGSRRNWSRKLVRATMVAGWENKVKGPWINHSCCAVHCNCAASTSRRNLCGTGREQVLVSM